MNSRNLMWISLFTALTAVSSWVRIPMFPVPFTLQTLVVYLSGSLLGPVRGAVSQILFLGIGLIGAPVFSGGGGPGYVAHPTFGYLLGFPVAAWLVGMLFRAPSSSGFKAGVRYLTGTGVIHGMGMVYLFIYFRWIAPKAFAISQLIWTGSLIFLPGELLKIAAAVIIHEKLYKLGIR